MKVTDAFLGEHAALYAQLSYVEGVLATSDLAQLQAAVAAVEAALASHADLEDRLLFAPLAEKLGSDAGPVAVMRREHELVEGAMERVRTAVTLDEAQAGAARLVEVARCHFGKEEHVLFGMAHQLLGAEQLETIGAQWAERRGVALS